MNNQFKMLVVYFFKNEKGAEPVKNWLRTLSSDDRKIIGEDIKTVQLGWPLGMPLVRSLGHGLWEVRSRITNSRIARVVFFMSNNAMILVNGFIKKTQATPPAEIKLALQRKKQFEDSL